SRIALRAFSSSASSASVAGDLGRRLSFAKNSSPRMAMGVRKSVTMIRPGLPGARLPATIISLIWTEPRADEEACRGDGDCEASFEASEGGIERGKPKPEIGVQRHRD